MSKHTAMRYRLLSGFPAPAAHHTSQPGQCLPTYLLTLFVI